MSIYTNIPTTACPAQCRFGHFNAWLWSFSPETTAGTRDRKTEGHQTYHKWKHLFPAPVLMDTTTSTSCCCFFLWMLPEGQSVAARPSAANLYLLTHCFLCIAAWQQCFSTTGEEWIQSTCAIKDKTPTLVVRSSRRLPRLDLMSSPCDVEGCPQTDWLKGAGSSQRKPTPRWCVIIYECSTSVKQTCWAFRFKAAQLRPERDFFLI